jgi:hypothetical protein
MQAKSEVPLALFDHHPIGHGSSVPDPASGVEAEMIE